MATRTPLKAMSERELRIELQQMRKEFKSLVTACESVLSHLDAEMAKPSSNERGQRIAKICNFLNIQKDIAKRFGLGVIK